MKMRLRLIALSLLFVVTAVAGVSNQQVSPAQLAFEAAKDVEVNQRDLSGAILRYRAVASAFPKDRAVAPEALFRLAGCLEQLGKPEALAAYEQVVKQYPNTTSAQEAQRKLALLAKGLAFTTTPLDGNAIGTPSLDGGYVSFTDWETGDLVVRDLASGRSRRVIEGDVRNGRHNATSKPSPDGGQIAYLWINQNSPEELRVISSAGGAASLLWSTDRSPASPLRGIIQLFGWSREGKQILFGLRDQDADTTKLVSLSVAGGAPKVLKTVQGMLGRAAWSPDGRFIIYDARPIPEKFEHSLFIMRSDGSNSAVLIPTTVDDRMLDWFPDGKRILFVRGNRSGATALFVQRMNDGKSVGDAFLVQDDPVGGRLSGLGFTRDGSYYYQSQGMVQDVMTFLPDASGAVSGEATRLQGRFSRGKEGAAWSPNGSEIAYVQAPSSLGAQPSLSIQSLATGQVRTMATDLARLARPTWTPDGLAIVVEGLTSQGTYGLYRIDLGNRAVTLIGETTTPGTGKRNPVVSLDGQELLYVLGQTIIQARNFVSGTVRIVFEGSPRTFALSPDGRFIAVVQFGQPLSIVPVAGGPPRQLALETKRGDGRTIAWSPDGQYVWFTEDARRDFMPIWKAPVDGGPPVHVNAVFTRPTIVWGLSAAPNGSLAVSLSMDSIEQWVMRNIPTSASATKR